MIFTRATHAHASLLAMQLRAVYARSGWKVHIERPLFRGDVYRVVVS